ncbi:kinase-like domain, phloem protein 2-like protein, partial [Tanacetum coccineum]
WFSLNEKGEHCHMISMKDCLIPNEDFPSQYKSNRWSRFPGGLYLTNNKGFKTHVKTRLLSPSITYTINLVFYASSDYQTYVDLKYRLRGETTTSTVYLANRRDDDRFLMAEYQVSKDDKVENIETISDPESYTYWEQKFPNDYEEILSLSKDSLIWTTKKELYSILRRGFLIDNGQQWFAIDKHGKKCLMLSERATWVIDDKKSACKSPHESRFGEVLVITAGDKFKIKGEIKSEVVSRETIYESYLVYKLPQDQSTFEAPICLCGKKIIPGMKVGQVFGNHEKAFYTVFIEIPPIMQAVSGYAGNKDSIHTAKEMTWHATGKCTEPGKMQHPVDGKAWKDFDTKYPDFAAEPRNVRLGLAADGFNPFGNLSQSYSMWPVILTTYNLPPWLCMKESSFMLTLLIPGPKSPGKDIDVYLRPLIDDLKDLWAKPGVETIDVANSLKFQYESDGFYGPSMNFPATNSLSGGSGKVTRHALHVMKTLHLHRQGKTRLEKSGHSKWLVARPKQKWEVLEASGCVFFQTRGQKKVLSVHQGEEALTFSSHYFRDVTTKFNRPDRNVDFPPPTCQFQVFKSLDGQRIVARVRGTVGGDDRPPSHQIPTGYGGCLGNRGKGTPKPNWVAVKKRAAKAAYPPGEPGTSAYWVSCGSLANYLGEESFGNAVCTTFPGAKCRRSKRRGSLARIGTSLTCVPTWNPIAGHLSMRPSSSIYKRSTMARRLLLRKSIRFLTRMGLTTWIESDNHVLATFLRSKWDARFVLNDPQNRARPCPKINKIGQKAKDEMLRLQGLGSNTETGVPYTEDEIMVIVRGGKQRGTFPVLVGFATTGHVILPRLHARTPLTSSDDKFSQMLTQLDSQPEIGGDSGSGGPGDDEQGHDEDDGETGRRDYSYECWVISLKIIIPGDMSPGKTLHVALISLAETLWARQCRPGKSPGNVSPSSFSAQLFPGDMSPEKRIPSDKSPGIRLICRWGIWQML